MFINFYCHIPLIKIFIYIFCFNVSRSLQVSVRTDAVFVRQLDDGTQSRVGAYFRTPPQLVNSGQDLDVPAIARNLNEQVETWNGMESGFNIKQISNCTVVTATYRPLHAATYIPTPEFLVKNIA